MATTVSDALVPFQAACAEPFVLPRKAAAAGRRVAGHMCTYTPEELLHAFGMLPVRILGWTDTTQRADGLIQSFACSLVRAVLDLGLSGQLDFLDTMVFSHTCDTIQNLADIWKRNIPNMDVITLATPVSTDGPHSARFYHSELARMRAHLESRLGPVADDAIFAAIDLYGRHRAAMRALYRLRRQRPGLISASAMQTVALASFLMPKDDHLGLLRDLENALKAAPDPAPGVRALPKVFVAGAACQQPEYLAVIEKAGCTVVGDDLCTGERAFDTIPADASDPIEALAATYLARRPCPAKHCGAHDSAKWLLNTARDANADGVVLLFTKFCDPWAFDYPAIRSTFEAGGMPVLLFEIEQHTPPSAQFETRIAAFAEIVGAASKE